MYTLWIKPPKLKHQGMNKQDQLELSGRQWRPEFACKV